MPLRTLHLTNSWHESSGGIGTFYRALLASAGPEWNVSVVVPSQTTSEQQLSPYARIYHVAAPRAPYSPEYRVLYPHLYLLPRGAIRRILNEEQPDVVEVNDKYTLIYLAGLLRIGAFSKNRRRPAVVGISCERMDDTLAAYTSMGNWTRRFAQAYMRYIYFEQCDHHVAVSNYVAEELRASSRGHRVARGVWIRGMGVDAEFFHPRRRCAAKRSELVAGTVARDQVKLLLYAGRLAPEKNLQLLLDTLKLLVFTGNFHLLIAGDGPERSVFLDAANASAPLKVTHLGYIPDRGKLADVMANVDVFLHPNEREPFGIAPLEAMASGTPLVAPLTGGVREYANHSNAWLAEPIAQGFAHEVTTILRDSPETRQRVQNALKTARSLDWAHVADSFRSLYSELHLRTLGQGSVQEPAFWSTSQA